jgi:hypothetical protein
MHGMEYELGGGSIEAEQCRIWWAAQMHRPPSLGWGLCTCLLLPELAQSHARTGVKKPVGLAACPVKDFLL